MTATLIARYFINFADGLSLLYLMWCMYASPVNLRRVTGFALCSSFVFGSMFFVQYALFPDISSWVLSVSALLIWIPVIWLLHRLFHLPLWRILLLLAIYEMLSTAGNLLTYFLYSFHGFSLDVRHTLLFVAGNVCVLAFVMLAATLIRVLRPTVKLPKVTKTKYLVFLAVSLAFFTVFYFSLFMIYDRYDVHLTNPDKRLLIFFLSALSLYFIFVIFFSIRLLKTDEFEQELEYQRFQNRLLEQLVGDLHRRKHGQDNILATLSGLTWTGTLEDVRGYLEELHTENSLPGLQNPEALSRIHHPGLSSILMSKIDLAQRSGVRMQLLVNTAITDIAMRTSHLTELCGILLDNAIEAAAQTNSRVVRLTLDQKDGELMLILENDTLTQPDLHVIHEKGWSSKGVERGYGLWIARNLVKKYPHVCLNTRVDSGRFCQELMILSPS